jgi:hypothetical protein
LGITKGVVTEQGVEARAELEEVWAELADGHVARLCVDHLGFRVQGLGMRVLMLRAGV